MQIGKIEQSMKGNPIKAKKTTWKRIVVDAMVHHSTLDSKIGKRKVRDGGFEDMENLFLCMAGNKRPKTKFKGLNPTVSYDAEEGTFEHPYVQDNLGSTIAERHAD